MINENLKRTLRATSVVVTMVSMMSGCSVEIDNVSSVGGPLRPTARGPNQDTSNAEKEAPCISAVTAIPPQGNAEVFNPSGSNSKEGETAMSAEWRHFSAYRNYLSMFDAENMPSGKMQTADFTARTEGGFPPNATNTSCPR